MKFRSPIILFILFLAFSSTTHAEGMSRSKGIGLRVSFWNITNHPTRIQASEYGGNASIDVGGAGGGFYFFSRMYQNWFLEFNLSAIGGVHEEHSNYVVETTEVSAVMYSLFGTRYDLLSVRLPSAIQPYFTLGGGPYWTSEVKQNDFALGGEVVVDSGLEYGAYFGGGINIVAASWFAFNFDLKYHAVDFNLSKGYSGIELGTGISLMWGSHREIFEVKDVKLIVSDLYPAYYHFYNTYPIALVSIKNVAGYPIEVNVKSNVDSYSERPGFTGFQKIANGKTVDIPVTVIFGSRLQQVTAREPAVLDLEIIARAGKTHKKELSAPIIVHNKNAWNGDVDKLNIFVTPENDDVLRMSRSFIEAGVDENNMNKAKHIFDNLSQQGIGYSSDPNIPFYRDDRVQYAAETLELGSGDCDDLVVLFASFLESVGISTAFVDVRDPAKKIAHLYLLFDTGLKPHEGHSITTNEKRYIVRKRSGNSDVSIWIPVETTLIAQGFDAAWNSGAESYLQEAIIRNGLLDGWVRIIDLE